jgi:rare lipoprotein A (peptidoglycan hydrolase)
VALPFSDDGADDSIESRTVTTTGQESDSHFPAPFRPAGSTRRATAAITLVTVSLVALRASPAPAQDAATLRAQRDALLTRIAAQTDQAEHDQAAVVAAEARADQAARKFADARKRLQTRAIDAYIYGLARAAEDLARPNIYLEAAFRPDRQGVAALRAPRRARTDAVAEAEKARDASRRASAALEAEREKLEATLAHREALDAELQAAAAARRAAAAAQEAASRPVIDIYETDPAARTRHRTATIKQRELMARYPFGPVTGIPPGLKPTGQTLTGTASWYGPGFDGRPTASGAIYDQEGWTVANKELPLGTILLVSENGRSVLLLVNDRGPFVKDWILDLSHAAAVALGHPGVGTVTAQVLIPG